MMQQSTCLIPPQRRGVSQMPTTFLRTSLNYEHQSLDRSETTRERKGQVSPFSEEKGVWSLGRMAERKLYTCRIFTCLSYMGALSTTKHSWIDEMWAWVDEIGNHSIFRGAGLYILFTLSPSSWWGSSYHRPLKRVGFIFYPELRSIGLVHL